MVSGTQNLHQLSKRTFCTQVKEKDRYGSRKSRFNLKMASKIEIAVVSM